MSCPKHRQPCAECERLQEIEASALQGLAEALENFVACSCLYYHSHSLDEFAKPIKLARAALDAAKKQGFIGRALAAQPFLERNDTSRMPPL